MKFQEMALTIGLAAAGVILAGYLMNTLYDSVPFIEKASDGFDM